MQFPGLKEGLQEPRHESPNQDSVLPSCYLNSSLLYCLSWLLHLVGNMPCPQLCPALCTAGRRLPPPGIYISIPGKASDSAWVMSPPLRPITGAGGWASMIGAVWVTCLPADNGVGIGESNRTLTTHRVYVMTGKTFPKERDARSGMIEKKPQEKSLAVILHSTSPSERWDRHNTDTILGVHSLTRK